MSGGGECRVTSWSEQGSKELGRFKLDWMIKTNEKWYRPRFVRNFWNDARDELSGKSLRQVIAQHKALSVTYWGADLAFIGPRNGLVAAANYPCLYASQLLSKLLQCIDKSKWHQSLNGALFAEHQPVCNIAWVMDRLSLARKSKISAVVPMSDYLVTHLLCGQQGHDPDMLQSLGLRGAAASATRDLLGKSLPDSTGLCPWPERSEVEFGQVGDCKVVFSTHDSVMARLLGLHETPFTVWTGSWCGVGASIQGLDVQPCFATLNAGLSFEGISPRVMQKNTGMFGPAYKSLLDRVGLTYQSVVFDERVTPNDDCTLDLSQLAGMDGDSAAEVVLNSLPHDKREPKYAAQELLIRAATCCYNDLQGLAGICDQPLKRVSVVGGFSQNAFFIKCLQSHGLEIVVPPHACEGADIATVVETIRRLALQSGETLEFGSILAQMP